MTHDTPPKRIWTRDLDGTGSQHPCWPDDEGAIAYTLASEADAIVAAALRGAAPKLLEWSDDWNDKRDLEELLVSFTPQPASAALDKLIAEAVAAERDRITRIAASLFPGGYDNNRIKIEDRLSEIAAKGAQT